MEKILFPELPEFLQNRTYEKHVKFIGYTENPQGRSYFIYEQTELKSYLHVKNETEDKFLLMMTIPFTWLRLAVNQIEGLDEKLEDILHYKRIEKDEEE